MLKLVGITKKFGKHIVLDGVNLSVKAGEIHGLVGLNGSGKSTLLNILFGSRIIAESGGFSGSYLLDDKPCYFKQSHQAVRCGIGMVHQEQALIPDLSVAENIQINREPVQRFSRSILPRTISPIDSKKLHNLAAGALAQLCICGYEKNSVGTLTLNIKQFIEIARELSRDDLKLLLLDEPTAVFSSTDVDRLTNALRGLAQKGTAIIFVSHRIDEIVNSCDRVTVLRDGKVAALLQGSRLTGTAITAAMVPHNVVKTKKISKKGYSSAKISVQNFQVHMKGDELRALDLTISSSEIFGLTGLSGSGRNSLGYGLMGLCRSSGTLLLDGRQVSIHSPQQMLRSGFFLLPEERHKRGLLLNHSIQDNIVFSSLHVGSKFRGKNRVINSFFPDRKKISDHAAEYINTFSINCRDINQKVSELSGGNQQKVSMAHALTLAPSVLLINEPTRGVDVAAKEIILEQILATSRLNGTTVIISSSELEELRRVCDRIGVLYKGKLQTILTPDTDETIFARAMMGEPRLLS